MASTFSQLINRKLIGKSVATLPAPLFSIFDRVYTSAPQSHPEIDFDIEEMTGLENAVVPVIKKGTAAIPLGNESVEIKKVSPDPIEVSRDINAYEMNKLRTYNEESMQAWTNKVVNYLVSRVNNTKAAMACKSLNGEMVWFRRAQADRLESYKANLFTVLGSPTGFTGSWAAATKASVVINDLNYMVEAQQDLGTGMNPVFFAGKTTFAALMDIANAQVNPAALIYQVNAFEIMFGGFRIINEQFRHHALASSGSISISSIVGAKELLLLDIAPGNFEQYALPIDDFEANLQALPLFVDSYIQKNPSVLSVVAKANPLYVPKKNSITKVTAAA